MTKSPGNRHLHRAGAIAALAVALPLAAASPGFADQPGKEQFSGQIVNTTGSGLCGFPITITTDYRGFEMDFTNQRIVHLVQQDTFSANGHTLTGLSYTIEVTTRFDADGNLVSDTAQGIVEKVTLPDGQMFVGAGRVNLQLDHGDIIFVPDVGSSPDVDAFCAALAP